MAGKIDQAWVQDYAVHVGIAALALVLVLRSKAREVWRPNKELCWFAAGLLGAAVLICFVAIVTGTSLGGLYEGVIGQPLRQADAFSVPLQHTGTLLGPDVVALAAAAGFLHLPRYGYRADRPAWVIPISLFSIFVGIAMCLASIRWAVPSWLYGQPLSMLAFAWVALIGVPGEDSDRTTEFAKRLLPALAVLQALHAYPVAGSQVGWSCFLLVPVAAICIGNGVEGSRGRPEPCARDGALWQFALSAR